MQADVVALAAGFVIKIGERHQSNHFLAFKIIIGGIKWPAGTCGDVRAVRSDPPNTAPCRNDFRVGCKSGACDNYWGPLDSIFLDKIRCISNIQNPLLLDQNTCAFKARHK